MQQIIQKEAKELTRKLGNSELLTPITVSTAKAERIEQLQIHLKSRILNPKP